MAEQGRTVRVNGLPTDIEDDRLKDKLIIHFLRVKNGGGEIDLVSIVKETPCSALITFEDSEVAQRVIQKSRHILEVDGKTYKLVVTEHHESLDPDKVIFNLSASINYSQLPGGILALTSLQKSHPDIKINYDIEAFCTLHGPYSKVQAALAQLLGQPEGPQLEEKREPSQPGPEGSRSAQTAKKPHTQESEDQSKKPYKQREKSKKVHTSRLSDEYNSNSQRDQTPSVNSWKDASQTEGAALQFPGHPTTSEEDFSLIVDADMFQYLQKHCSKEYHHILSQYGVEVVDMTNQGLTTLFLHVATVDGEGGQDRLVLARKAISRLYHENETKIRRAQLPKIILSPRGGLQRAIENLNVRLPKLLLSEDDINIYIIGSSSDVSEAKQYLLLDHDKASVKKDDVANSLGYSPYDSSSLSPAHEVRVPFTISTNEGSLDDRINQLPRLEDDERRAEGTKRYKLAAWLGSRPTDFTLRGMSAPARQIRIGPMLGHDVLSEAAGISGEKASRAKTRNSGDDILFKGGDSSYSFSTLNSNVAGTRPKTSMSPLGGAQASLSGNTTLPPAGSGSTLKRASSFSGTPQQKAQVMNQKSQDEFSVRARARSSSFSTQTVRDKPEVHSAEITVSLMMWQHIKEAYNTRVDDLTSDVQIKESRPDSSGDVTITIRGANSSKVSSCQLGLQKLVESVNADFSVQELLLSALGVTDPTDETLHACCVEVHSRFKKVTLQILNKSLILLGPKKLCSQVGATLQEVFSGDVAEIPEQQNLSCLSASHWNPSAALQMNEEQSVSLQSKSNNKVMLASQTGKADEPGSGQERRSNHMNDFCETELVNRSSSHPSARKDPVIKEKVKIADSLETDRLKTESGNKRNGTCVNGVGSTSARSEKAAAVMKEKITLSTQKGSSQQRQGENQNTPEESTSAQGDPGFICVCGDNGMSANKTKCGASMCSKCLHTVHVHCKVCYEMDLTPQGIRGKMRYSKLDINVPGHTKDSAIKITYNIPDGIQGKGHPSPGKPFKGGQFEAFLPDCERMKNLQLLPRLEKAFRQGLTFTVTGKEAGAKATWDCIPHKTSLQGGKSGNGYPDSTYLSRLSQVLSYYGLEEPSAKSYEQKNTSK